MAVESNCAVMIAMSIDWLKNCASFSTNEKQNQNQNQSNLQVIAANSDWFIARFSPVVIGHRNYFGITWFLNSHLKTALSERCLVRFTGRVSTQRLCLCL